MPMLRDSQHRSMFTSIYFQRVHIYSTDFCAIVVPSSVNNINFNCFVVFSSLAILCTFRPVFHFHMMWLCVMCNDHNSTWRYATNSEIVHSKTSLFSLTLSWAFLFAGLERYTHKLFPLFESADITLTNRWKKVAWKNEANATQNCLSHTPD